MRQFLDDSQSMYIHFLNRLDTAPNVAKKDKKKKDAQLVLRLNKEVRNRFIDACQDLDTTAAREVRRFIKGFLKRYDRGDFNE